MCVYVANLHATLVIHRMQVFVDFPAGAVPGKDMNRLQAKYLKLAEKLYAIKSGLLLDDEGNILADLEGIQAAAKVLESPDLDAVRGEFIGLGASSHDDKANFVLLWHL